MSVKSDLARMRKRITMLGGAPSAKVAKMLADLTADLKLAREILLKAEVWK